MKPSRLASIASGLLVVAGTTLAWSDCRQVTVDGVSDEQLATAPADTYRMAYWVRLPNETQWVHVNGARTVMMSMGLSCPPKVIDVVQLMRIAYRQGRFGDADPWVGVMMAVLRTDAECKLDSEVAAAFVRLYNSGYGSTGRR